MGRSWMLLNGRSADGDFSEFFLDNLADDIERGAGLGKYYCDCERMDTEWTVRESYTENETMITVLALSRAENPSTKDGTLITIVYK